MNDPGPPARRGSLQSVGIALQVLEVLADSPGLSLGQLAQRVGVAKSTAHRTCAVLAEAGVLARSDDGRYSLGLRLVEYGHLASARSAVGEHALALLVDLRNAVGETVQVGVPLGGDVVYVERVEGRRALRYSAEQSRRSPVHRSSGGKVLAAWIPGVLEARLAAGLTPSTGYTIVVPDVLHSELELVRRRGWARSVEETELGVSSLAVPVRSAADGPVVAAISMIGPTARVVRDREAANVVLLRSAAAELTAALQSGRYRLPRRRL